MGATLKLALSVFSCAGKRVEASTVKGLPHAKDCVWGPIQVWPCHSAIWESRPLQSAVLFDSAEQSQQHIQNGDRVGRAAGDVEIHRDDRSGTVVDFRVAAEDAARDGAGANHNDDPGLKRRRQGT